MAKKTLKIKDRQGNEVDYGVPASRVMLKNNEDLDDRLDDIGEDIQEINDNSVKSVTFNGNSTTPGKNGNINIGQQITADWNENNPNYPSFIRNKPTIPAGVVIDQQLGNSNNAIANKAVNDAINTLQNTINTLIGSGNVQGAIDTFNEVVAFLSGISSSDTLAAKLAQLATDISGKVDKETGKGLSTNDYTDAEKTKLGNIEAGAEVNVIEGIQVNGTDVTPTNKVVNITTTAGKSAYQSYLDTTDDADQLDEDEWVASLKGDKGDTGNVEFEDLEDLVALLVNDLTTGGAGNFLSAEMGKRLRNKIIELENNFQDLLSKLANLAFVGTKPTYSEIDWSAPKHTVTLDLTGVSNASVLGTWPKQVVEGQDVEITVVPDGEYTLNSVSYKVGANGTTQQATVDGNQSVITVNVTADVTIYITAAAGFRIWFNKSLDQNGVPVTDNGVCYTDFIKLDNLSSASEALYTYNLPTDPDNSKLKTKCNAVFYDRNKRLIYLGSKWDAIWHPRNITQTPDNSRTLTTALLAESITAAGQNLPMYARFSFAMSGDTIASGCGFSQGSKQYVNIADAVAANTAEAVHNLTFSLTHCTTTATGNQDKVLHGQPVEVLLQAASGYSLSNLQLSVTMGVEDVTADVTVSDYSYNNVNYKKVSLENVTGDVVITASM